MSSVRSRSAGTLIMKTATRYRDLAERALRDGALEILVRRGDEPDVVRRGF